MTTDHVKFLYIVYATHSKWWLWDTEIYHLGKPEFMEFKQQNGSILLLIHFLQEGNCSTGDPQVALSPRGAR